MSKLRTGRKPIEESKKVKQKKVYLSDEKENELLKSYDGSDLTELLRNLPTKPETKTTKNK